MADFAFALPFLQCFKLHEQRLWMLELEAHLKILRSILSLTSREVISRVDGSAAQSPSFGGS